MALQKIGEKALIAHNRLNSEVVKLQPKKQILEEEKYVEDLEKIIVRDFYPDLPKLQVQKEYLDALERNDREKLRQIHVKYGPRRPVVQGKTPDIYATPSTFETPIDIPKGTPKPDVESSTEHTTEGAGVSSGINRLWTGEPDGGSNKTGGTSDPGDGPKETTKEGPTHNPEPHEVKKKEASNMRLDKYLSQHTSEDNASFGEIMEEADKKHRIKHGWLYEQELEKSQDLEGQLALPSINQQAIESGNSTKLQTWKYTPKNAIMYVPEGVEHSSKEVIEARSKLAREIDHKNTRFIETPFNLRKSAQSIAEAANTQAALLQGKVGVDGKEVLPGTTPKVNGYGFVATPSPAPGVEDSPMMTWGEIEGTPFRLDGGDTPLRAQSTQGPQFKIPGVPNRDRIGLELAEKASKAHRAKKQKAMDNVKSNFASPVPQFGASKTDRLGYLSPAAQRLASSKLGITRTGSDKALRASYTPSPSSLGLRSSGGLNTPLSLLKTPTPGTSVGSSRRHSQRGTINKSGLKTPGVATPTSSPSNTHKRDSNGSSSSLTDNLLNLPKRQKAQDYF